MARTSICSSHIEQLFTIDTGKYNYITFYSTCTRCVGLCCSVPSVCAIRPAPRSHDPLLGRSPNWCIFHLILNVCLLATQKQHKVFVLLILQRSLADVNTLLSTRRKERKKRQNAVCFRYCFTLGTRLRKNTQMTDTPNNLVQRQWQKLKFNL